MVKPTRQTGGYLMATMSRLRRRMIEDKRVPNLSPATQRSYLQAVSRFSQYFGRSPDRLEMEDVRAFQVPSGVDGDFLADAEPDGPRFAVLSWRNTNGRQL